MKKKHLAGVIIIGVAIAVIVSTLGDASTYVSFSEARSMAESGKNAKVHVVGQLVRDDSGQARGVEPTDDKLAVHFMMADNNNEVQRVFYNEPMPPDLLRSEQVVVVGNYRNGQFEADQILLKCPSKYQDENVAVEATVQ
jgi:cytochrome c-type biogenesis protein CcmE